MKFYFTALQPDPIIYDMLSIFCSPIYGAFQAWVSLDLYENKSRIYWSMRRKEVYVLETLAKKQMLYNT